MTKDERREIDQLREEITLLRERLAVLEARPLYYPYYPVPPYYVPVWGDTGTGYDVGDPGVGSVVLT